MQQHQRQEPKGLRLRKELDEQPTQTDRLGGEIVPRQRGARRCGVALVEHEIDDAQHGVEPLRQLGPRRNLIGNARVADLGLRAHDALRQCRRRREKRLGNLLRRQTADLAQRERDLRIGGQRRMATREDQAKAVVFDGLIVCPGRGIDDGDVGFVADVLEGIEASAPAQAVDGLEAAGRHQPRTRIGGDAVARPLLERRPERIVQRLFGQIEITEQPDQRREHATGVGEIDGVHRLVHWTCRRHRDRSDHLHCPGARPVGGRQASWS